MTYDEKLKANLEVIMKYMTAKGQDRADRWKLFCDNATTGLQYTASGKPAVTEGIDAIRERNLAACENFPDWGFENFELFCSPGDPDSFLIECDGGGTSLLGGKPVRHSDHYIHKFVMSEGKILTYREFMNPCNELIELGLEIPSLPKEI